MRKIRKTRQYTEGFENAGKTAETRKRKAVEGNSNDKEVSVAEYACPKKKKKKKMKQSEMRSKN
ncbi:hypothetical protein KIN20_001800 [Parelaphostrongylus tenuis]|uniref:Uncharacterized protein n=1 Tax=Parelaphostrongylus tenuis TaxID=148309 RepID=A0AAD5LU89_PARTN|nr:hypothetical protein KIN20_001800 [Parelaphostrongylus tenuis]